MKTYPSESSTVSVRRLQATDVPVLLHLIQALADYEKLSGPDQAARERLARDATSDPPCFSALLAEQAGRAIGYAVYFETYSTFLAKPTLFLEDIFVLPESRRSGAGSALMRELIQEAARRGCGRMEWQVLSWNTPAMAFYRRFGGARLEEWESWRMVLEQNGRPPADML